MKISDMLASGRPTFSFEFFPPKTPEDTKALHAALSELEPLKPDFVSVTHSSSGTAFMRTAALAGLIRDRFGMEPMAHLTCISHSKKDIAAIAAELGKMAIRNVLALRGDIPRDGGSLPQERDYRYANELVSDLRGFGDFCIGVAGYPEKHPEAVSPQADARALKRKVDAGASFVITQLFFENKTYFDFVKLCRAEGITVPIIPGIMPIRNMRQLDRCATMCGAAIPQKMSADLEKLRGDPHAVAEYGVRYALAQCRELLSGGAPGLHFYTFNKSKATREILRQLR